MCCPVVSEKTINGIDEMYDFLFESSNLPWNGSSSESLVYRGVNKCWYDLVPSLFRNDNLSIVYKNIYNRNINDNSGAEKVIEGRKAEYIVVSEFVRRANELGLYIPHMNDVISRYEDFYQQWPPKNMIEQMSFAQHYGLPTRLLDWTFDPLVALFFAVSGSNDSDSAVWILNTDVVNYINTLTSLEKYYSNKAEPFLHTLVPTYFENANVLAQRGLFTYISEAPLEKNNNGEYIKAEEDIDAFERNDVVQYFQHLCKSYITLKDPILFKLTISKKLFEEIRKMLNKLGYSKNRLFPSYDSIAANILEDYCRGEQMMQKTVAYLYPDTDKAANLKVFQDRTNQIKGFYFTRDNIKCVEKLESGTNYAVYFLFDKSTDGEMTKVYVGQSKKGAHRMENHHTTKLFWSYCLMFVTDNNSFDALAIDYMEYYFIQLLKKSSQFSLDNKDMRITEPNVSIYDKPTVLSYIEQINFLLKAEGIDFSESPSLSTDNYYSPKSSKYRAKLYVKDGKFVLAAGSVVVRPIESAKDWSDGGKFFDRFTSVIDDFISEGKIQAVDSGYEAVVNLSFNSPSMAASLISGRAENGWLFFEGLNGLR